MERIRKLVESPGFEKAIIGAILVNAVVVGMETSPTIMARFEPVLHFVNTTILAIFVIEISLRI